jgi:hypothetical protein
MRVHLEVELEIDGEIPEGTSVGGLLVSHLLKERTVILSEEVDGTKDWVIEIGSMAVEGELA